MPRLDLRVGADVDALVAVDRGVDLSDLAAQRPLQRDRKRLHEEHFLAELAG